MNAVSISQPMHSPTPPTTPTTAATSSFPFACLRASHARRLCDSLRKYCLRSGLWKNAWRMAERKHVWERLRRGRIAERGVVRSGRGRGGKGGRTMAAYGCAFIEDCFFLGHRFPHLEFHTSAVLCEIISEPVS